MQTNTVLIDRELYDNLMDTRRLWIGINKEEHCIHYPVSSCSRLTGLVVTTETAEKLIYQGYRDHIIRLEEKLKSTKNDLIEANNLIEKLQTRKWWKR